MRTFLTKFERILLRKFIRVILNRELSFQMTTKGAWVFDFAEYVQLFELTEKKQIWNHVSRSTEAMQMGRRNHKSP